MSSIEGPSLILDDRASAKQDRRTAYREGPIDLPIERDGLGRLRTAVAAGAAELGAEEVREDLVLLVHELATNVVRHGGGRGRLRLWRETRQIVCRVSDSGPGLPATARREPPASSAPGGRGLWIAGRLADVHIETGPAGTVVVAALPSTER